MLYHFILFYIILYISLVYIITLYDIIILYVIILYYIFLYNMIYLEIVCVLVATSCTNSIFKSTSVAGEKSIAVETVGLRFGISNQRMYSEPQ